MLDSLVESSSFKILSSPLAKQSNWNASPIVMSLVVQDVSIAVLYS